MARHGWIASPLVVVAMSGGSYWRKSTDVRELAKVNDRVPQPIALVTDFPFSRRTESVHAQRATLNMTHKSEFCNRSTPYSSDVKGLRMDDGVYEPQQWNAPRGERTHGDIFLNSLIITTRHRIRLPSVQLCRNLLKI